MTIRQIINDELGIDTKTQENNIKVLSDISGKLSREDQQKMQAVLQGMKQQLTANQAVQKQENAEKQKAKSALPNGNVATTAQPSNSNTTAQSSNSDSQTAQ